jgi:DNA-binding NarL/FixJ family response regulator
MSKLHTASRLTADRSCPRLHVLLIEDDDGRRVETLQYLLRCNYAVRLCGSVSEAHEIVQNMTVSATAPQIVIIAEHLEREGGACLRRELDGRFAGIRWILYPRTCDIAWLSERLGSTIEDFMGGGSMDSG